MQGKQSPNRRLYSWGKSVVSVAAIVFIIFSVFRPTAFVSADPILTVQPITWNVVGLDSNNVNTGPNNFPVGARVCNTGTDPATNVTATFVWDDGNDLYTGDPFINLRSGSLSEITIDSLALAAPDNCFDFYFEVSLARNSGAYFKTRRYHIEITADGGLSLSTPRPREIYVERLVSQSRNYTQNMLLDGAPIPPGGTMSLVVGETYMITLEGKTATNGYEQIESFINFPNTIFQVNSVTTTFTADAGTDPDAASKLYADGCTWENDPDSPNYRSCLSTGKYGGNISVTYNVTIIGGGGTNQTLTGLVYDFSGASYHYNSDLLASSRIAAIYDSTTAGFAKRFIPGILGAGDTATLRFTITNPNPVTVSGYHFVDNLPGDMLVADPANASSTCGGSITAIPDTAVISFDDGVIGPNSSCTILANVTVPYDAGAAYPLTLDNSADLYVGDSDMPSATATASLVVTEETPPPLVCGELNGEVIAVWSSFLLANNPNHPPTGPVDGLGIGTAAGAGNTTTVSTNLWVGNVPSDSAIGDKLANARTLGQYWEFVVETTGLDEVALTFSISRQNNNAPSSVTLDYGPSGSFTLNAQTWGPVSTNAGSPSVFSVSNLTNLADSGNTFFRFYIYDAANPNIEIRIHNMSFTGWGTICTPVDPGDAPSPPTISKVFNPTDVRVGEVSSLTFTLANPNTGDGLSGITFRDELPSGMTAVAGTFLNNCSTGSSWGTEGGDPAVLLFTDGELAASTSCTLSVDVASTSVGSNLNLSDPVDAIETLPGNNATATLNVLPHPTAPVFFKQFDPNPLLDPAGSTTLTFRITNTDPALGIADVAFTDTLPAGMEPVDPFGYSDNGQCGASYSFTWNAGTNELSFSGGAISADGICEIEVEVEVPGVDVSGGAVEFINLTSVVSHVFNGTTYPGNSASSTLVVDSPNPGLYFLKQVGPTDSGPWSSFLAVDVSDNVYYRFVVENTGDVALTGVTVADPDVDPGTCTWVDGDGMAIIDTDPGPGFAFTLPVADDDEGHLAYCVPDPVTAVSGWSDNTAEANSVETEAAHPADYPVASTASYATTGLTLVKSADRYIFLEAGDTLTYEYLVTNSGAAPLRGPVTVNDDRIVPPDEVACQDVTLAVVGSDPGDGDNFLDPGESVTCTATYIITAGDNLAGSVTNTATASADGVASNPDSVTATRAAPEITVEKSVSVDGGTSWVDANDTPGPNLSSGADPIFRFTVTNSGDATLMDISLSDTVIGAFYESDLSTACAIPDTLAPDAGFTCYGTLAWAAGQHSNTATAQGTYEGISYEDTDDAHYFGVQAAIQVLKSSTTTGITAAGQVVPYTFTVSNAGNVSLTNVTVDDPNCDAPPAYQSGDTDSDGELDLGETWVYTCSRTVTQPEIDAGGDLSNIVTVDSDESDPDTDSLDIPITPGAALEVTKSSTTAEITAAGQVVPYVFQIANAASVALTNITVSDPNCDAAPAYQSGDTDSDGELDLDETWVYTCSRTVTQPEIDAGGNLSNTVTADSDESAPDSDSLDIPITQSPAIQVVKSSTTSGITAAGQVVPYTFTLTNTGNISLTNITVDDPDCDDAPAYQTGDTDTDSELDLTETWVYTCSRTVTQDEINTGGNLSNTVTADSDESAPDTDSLDIPVTQSPAIQVVKSSTTTGIAAAGQVVPYAFTLTNTGNIPLTNISVGDPDCDAAPAYDSGDTDTDGELDLDETWIYTCSRTVTQPEIDAGGSLSNTVTADSDESAPDTDSLDIPITQSPSLDTIKDVSDDGSTWVDSIAVAAGDTVYFRVRLQNSGNVTLTGLSVDDGMAACTLARAADDPGDDDSDFEPGETWVYTCSITAEAGARTNTATADSNETGPDSDDASYFGNAPLIGAAKRRIGSPVLVSAGTWDVTYEILVRNYGNVALDDLQVADDLAATFPPATTYTVQSLVSADLTVNPAFDGDADTNLLAGTDSLAVGAQGTITLVLRVVPASSGPFENTAVASAQPPSGDQVSDDSQDGANPDPDNDGDPTNNNDPTEVSFGPNIFDPPIGIKLLDPSGQPVLRWTMFWINNSNIVAVNARVSDPIPAGATYLASGLPSGYPVPGGAPAGSTNVGVSCTDTSPITETTLCYYEGPTGPYPRGRIIWAGTLGPDLGATDAASAAHEIAITFYMTANPGASLVQNVATIDSDRNGDGDTDDPGEQQVASAQAAWDVRTTGFTIPPTGFAPGKISSVPQQPADSAYARLGDLWLEIPTLGIQTAIVGVPRRSGDWDVSWLWDQAGWLEGTAFPTTPGNSAITSHVYRSDGQPGPFVNLRTLRWGDQVIVHANGQRYVYEVRDVRRVLPNNTKVFQHEEYSWLTLITCQGYNPADNTYRYRTVVRAVLMRVEPAASRPPSTR